MKMRQWNTRPAMALAGQGGGRVQALARLVYRDFVKHRTLYLMAIPMILFYLLFFYQPMYGASIAFKDYAPRLGIAGSKWAGFKHFEAFFRMYMRAELSPIRWF